MINLEAAAGTSVSLAAITAAVEENKPAMVFLVQGESSTGVHQNLAGVGELCRKHGALLVRQGSNPGLSMADQLFPSGVSMIGVVMGSQCWRMEVPWPSQWAGSKCRTCCTC